MSIPSIFKASTYRGDLPLFKELGLMTFRDDETREPIALGVVRFPTATVRVSVTCLPAHFWRFEIERWESERTCCVLTTGSGALRDYWPAIKQVAEGMLVFAPAAPLVEKGLPA